MIVRRLNSDTGLPLVCFFLPPLAPLTLWLVELAPLKRMASAKRVALQIGMPAVMALIAVGIAVASMLSSMDASGY